MIIAWALPLRQPLVKASPLKQDKSQVAPAGKGLDLC